MVPPSQNFYINLIAFFNHHALPWLQKTLKLLILPIFPRTTKEANEDPPQELQNLIATLPIKLDRFQSSLYQYQTCDFDILLATLPKSGTTWLKALTFAIVNREIHNPSPILTTNPHILIPSLERRLQQHKNMSNLSSFSSPRIYASHIPYGLLPESLKQSRCKIVYLCRNPKDMFVSLWHFLGKLKPQTQGSHSVEDSFDDFCQGVSIYGPFWDHMLGYYKESLEWPWKILFLRYEELKEDPVRTLKLLAEFIGYGFSPEEENSDVVGNILKLCSFENLSSLEVNRTESSIFGIENKLFFRRGGVGDWKNLLTIDMVKRLNTITHEKLEKHGLKF